MSRRQRFKLVGVGAVACAACCAGPILAVLTTAGLVTIAGYVMFGAVALVVGAVSIGLILRSRSRRRSAVEARVQIAERPAHL